MAVASLDITDAPLEESFHRLLDIKNKVEMGDKLSVNGSFQYIQ